MKHIKPGRGPSLMGGIASIFAAVIGIVWTLAARNMGAPGALVAFGVVFILFGVGNGLYNLLNATRKNRFSSFDVTDDQEEPDPLNQRFGAESEKAPGDTPEGEIVFCPYCGAKVAEGYRYCLKCGRKLPEGSS